MDKVLLYDVHITPVNSEHLRQVAMILRSIEIPENARKDRHVRKLLMYLFTGTRGGLARLRIVTLLLQEPCNAHRISLALEINYKVARHHLRVLERENLVVAKGSGYGTTYEISPFLMMYIHMLQDAIPMLERKNAVKKVYY